MDYVIAAKSKCLQMMVAHSVMSENLDQVTRHFEQFNADFEEFDQAFLEVTQQRYRGNQGFKPLDTSFKATEKRNSLDETEANHEKYEVGKESKETNLLKSLHTIKADKKCKSEHKTKVVSEDQTEVDELGKQLEQLPELLIQFTQTLRSFYAKNQVSGDEATTSTGFIEVRDDVTRKALVYRDNVLPMKKEVIRAIAFFADTFNSLEFDEWVENLEDIIKELERAHGFCDMLKDMHKNMIKDLFKNKEKAKMSVELLQKLQDNYEQQREKLDDEVQKAKQDFLQSVDDEARWTKQAEKDKGWAYGLAIPTAGVTHLLYNKGADEAIKEAQNKAARANEFLERSGLALATSLALTENSNIASRAVALTLTHIIPSLEQFLDGLETSSTFIRITLQKLKAMHGAGTGVTGKDRREEYFTMMTKKSGQLNSLCEVFLARSDLIEINLGDLPDSASTKNYVDLWFDQVKADFAEFARIHGLAITNKSQTERL